MTFTRFVGIDWSGAKGAGQRGIQVAEIKVGESSPHLVAAPSGRNWSRRDILDHILDLDEEPTLVGIDFAFSIPWDTSTQLFGLDVVNDVRTLWARIDGLCQTSPHLYAGPVWLAADSPFRPYIFHHQSGHRGDLYDRKILREADRCEGNAISVYHMVGPQVGAGSFAGMRMLHQLTERSGPGVSIWPFDAVDGSKTTVVEIYPSFFYRLAGAARPRTRDLARGKYEALDSALSHYNAKRTAGSRLSVDQADALISAAALRQLANGPAAFEGPNSGNWDVREGWIFGLPPDASGKI